MHGPVAFVLKGYPRLSETFIAQEILGLERRGLDIRIVSLRRPTERAVHPIHREIRAPVLYLPEYVHEAPGRVAAAWREARRRPGYAAAARQWRRDLIRDPSRNRARRFAQALVLAAELPAGIDHLHAHFLHTPASVARYAALITGLPWSCSAHAKDIWTTPAWEKRDKLASLAWLATCTRTGAEHLRGLAGDPAKVDLVYHGLDFARFPPPPARPPRDGGDPGDPAVILSVGRAVAKKGYEDLLDALKRLPGHLNWRLVHIGGGDRAALERRAAALGLDGRVTWQGAQAQEAVLAAYRQADLFALAARVAPDGDRDGLPNVLMEAASQRLAIAATSVSGIPELIEDGVHGLLAPPGDVAALARHLATLIAAPALRERLGGAAFARVRGSFDHDRSLDRLAPRFGLAVADTAPCASPSTPR